MKIGYLGPEGSYSHQATLKYVQGISDPYQLKPFTSTVALLDGFFREESAIAIVPFENGIGGEVTGVVPWFFRHAGNSTCHIVGEIRLAIEHVLLGRQQAEFSDVTTVLSKDNALAQCSEFLNSNALRSVAVDSTARAAQTVAETDDSALSAIASVEAANQYGLKILRRGIMNVAENKTRFLVIGRANNLPAKKEKTTIVFETKNEAGALYHCLGAFFYCGINLSRIDSGTTEQQLGKYAFWVDADIGSDDPSMAIALRQLKIFSDRAVVLGSYPVVE